MSRLSMSWVDNGSCSGSRNDRKARNRVLGIILKTKANPGYVAIEFI